MKKTKKPNIPLLRKIQKAILKYHDQFDMADWFDEVNSMGEEPGRCGTSACIAGWAITLSRTNDFSPRKAKRGIESLWDVDVIAADLLKLSTKEKDSMFYHGTWPERFSDRYNAATTTLAKAKAASDRIEHFIKTGA